MDSLPPERSTRLAAMTLGLLALLLALGLVHVLAFCSSNQINDDAFIFLRYADNLRAGHGLTWNPGGEWVEGYSSLLYVLLLAGLRSATSMEPVVLLHVLNMGLFVALLVALTGLGAVLHRSLRPAALLPAFLVATSGTFGHWTRSGMETILFALLLVLSVTSYLQEARREEARRRDGWISGTLFGLAALCRPEGILVYLGVVGTQLVHPARSGPRFTRADGWRLFVVVLLVLGHHLWRYAVYGEWFPNTYYAKVAFGGWPVERGARGLLLYLSGFAGASTLLGVLLVARMFRARAGKFLATQLLGWLLYFTLYLGLLNWSAAYVMPLLLFSFIAVGWLLPRTIGAATSGGTSRGVALAGLVLVVAANAAETIQLRWGKGPRLSWQVMDSPDRALVNDFIWIGRRMAEIARPGETLVTGACGAIPYYSGLVTYDSLGLNDRHIAHTPMPEPRGDLFGHEKGDGEYLLDLEPTYLIAVPRLTPGPARSHPGVEKSFFEIFASPRLARDYELITERTSTELYFSYWRRRGARAP